MTKQTTNEQQSSGNISDILLIMDKEGGKIYGMKGVGKYDEFETAEVRKENQEQFMRFKKNNNFLSDFLMNFFMEIQNPSLYKFFTVPESKAVELAKEIQMSVDNPSKEGRLLLTKYELPTDSFEQQLKFEQKNIDTVKQQKEQENPKTPVKYKGRKM